MSRGHQGGCPHRPRCGPQIQEVRFGEAYGRRASTTAVFGELDMGSDTTLRWGSPKSASRSLRGGDITPESMTHLFHNLIPNTKFQCALCDGTYGKKRSGARLATFYPLKKVHNEFLDLVLEQFTAFYRLEGRGWDRTIQFDPVRRAQHPAPSPAQPCTARSCLSSRVPPDILR